MGMQVNIEITIDEVENQMNIDLSGEEMGILIGKRGITLDSLPFIALLALSIAGGIFYLFCRYKKRFV